MKTFTIVRLVKFFLYVVVIGTPLFYFSRGVYPYTLAKSLFFQAAVEAAFFLWIVLVIFDRRYLPKRTPFMVALAVFLAALVLTAALGVDFWRSFWSIQERAVGVFTFLHLGAFAVILSSLYREISWKRLCYCSLVTAAVVDVIALMQPWIPNLLLVEDVGSRPGATFGNPTFLAGYVALNVFIGLYFLFKIVREKSGGAWEFIFLGVSVLLNVCAIVLAQTRGDILGLGVGILLLLILFAIRPPRCGALPPWRPPRLLEQRGWYVAALVVIAALCGVFWATRSSPLWQRVPGISRFQGISLSGSEFTPRLVALRAAWSGFIERPVFGFGWDNFNVVFNKYYDPRALEANYQETRFDKPHNALVEYFVVGGALLGLAYLFFLLAVIFELWKGNDVLLAQVAAAALAVYFIRNLFIFETIGPLLMLFFIAGMADGAYWTRRVSGGGNGQEARVWLVPRWAVLVAAVAAASLTYTVNVSSFIASHDQFLAYRYLVSGKTDQAIKNFTAAVDMWTPYKWGFKRDYATAVAEAYFYNPGLVPPDEAVRAVRAMEDVAREHPLDAYNHYALIDLYNQIYDVNPSEYLPKAEAEAARALALSPDRQEIYFSLAKTKTLEKQYGAALDLLKKALALDPKVPDAHFYYGLVAYVTGDSATGYSELRAAMQLGRKWKNKYEPRVVAGFFADSGYLAEAIELYKTSLSLGPDDLETQAKLGIAYFFAGEKGLAKQYLGEVAKRTDLTKSALYAELAPILRDLGVISGGSE